MTPFEAMQPLIDQVLKPVRHVEPPIAAQDEAQKRLAELKLDRATYRQLLETTERLIAIYEIQAGIPF